MSSTSNYQASHGLEQNNSSTVPLVPSNHLHRELYALATVVLLSTGLVLFSSASVKNSAIGNISLRAEESSKLGEVGGNVFISSRKFFSYLKMLFSLAKSTPELSIANPQTHVQMALAKEMATTTYDCTVFQSYHIHVLFWQNNAASTASATALRTAIIKNFGLSSCIFGPLDIMPTASMCAFAVSNIQSQFLSMNLRY